MTTTPQTFCALPTGDNHSSNLLCSTYRWQPLLKPFVLYLQVTTTPQTFCAPPTGDNHSSNLLSSTYRWQPLLKPFVLYLQVTTTPQTFCALPTGDNHSSNLLCSYLQVTTTPQTFCALPTGDNHSSNLLCSYLQVTSHSSNLLCSTYRWQPLLKPFVLYLQVTTTPQTFCAPPTGDNHSSNLLCSTDRWQPLLKPFVLYLCYIVTICFATYFGINLLLLKPLQQSTSTLFLNRRILKCNYLNKILPIISGPYRQTNYPAYKNMSL